MPDFFGLERLSLGPWAAFERAVQRLLLHAGFDDVRLVAGSGDSGADVVGELRGKVWAVQAKFRRPGLMISAAPIDEVTAAIARYGASVGLLACNTGFTPNAVAAARKRAADIGVPIYLWDRDIILQRGAKLSLYPEHRDAPRLYQTDAIEAINEQVLRGAERGLLLMATGLGKTRVAAGVIEQWLNDHPNQQVLVLAPTLNLVSQLEASLWPYLPKTIATHQLTGSEKPTFEGGVTVATHQSMLRLGLDASGSYGLIVVDEAHHAPADAYSLLLKRLAPQFLLGMTATPWRGDERQLAELFGEPLYSLGIVEGMQAGYLARVDYRMLIDNLDWEWIAGHLKGAVTIRELNKRLFIPERDEAVVAKIRTHFEELPDPRCIIFCRSIAHAESIANLLRADGLALRIVHSKLDRFETTRALHEFRSRAVPILVTVDMLNEGIDLPDVNLVVFLRVTHSRRIFVQQLGRGLRVTPEKAAVRVLDFVSDVRRVAAGMELNHAASDFAGRSDNAVLYRSDAVVKFDNDQALAFFQEYLSDVAELDDAAEEARLKFPPG